MSINAVIWVSKLSLPPNEKLVLWCLCDHYNDNTMMCYPSTKRIEKFTGLSARTIHRVIKKLEDVGYITVIKRIGTSSNYNINFEHNIDKGVTHSHQCHRVTCDRESEGVVTHSHRTSDTQSPKPVNKPVNKPVSRTTTKTKDLDKQRTKKFVPPKLEEVIEYCTGKGYTFSAEKWHSYYSANGWKVGKNNMVDWKAACRTWAHSDKRNKPDDPPRRSRRVMQ